jgi:ketosteroid isomerase-like protein
MPKANPSEGDKMAKHLAKVVAGAGLIFLTFLTVGTANSGSADKKKLEGSIVKVLNDFHDAAAKADEKRYMGHLTADAIFMGTDAEERWSKVEFQKYVQRYFSQGRGWTYVGRDRMITFNTAGNTAWFSERLTNEKYGELRGSGVLEKVNGHWKICQYNMVFVVPNGVAGEVVKLIRAFQKEQQKCPSPQP